MKFLITLKDELNKRRELIIAHYPAILLVLIAVILRLCLTVEFSRNYPFYFKPLFGTDMSAYIKEAGYLVLGIFQNKPFYWNPFYYNFLSLIFSFTDFSIYSAILIQQFMGIGTLLLIYKLTEKMFNPRTALIALFFAVFYKQFYFFEEFLLIETTQTFFLVLFIYYLYSREVFSTKEALLSGILFGVQITIRSNMLIFFPFLLFWLIKQFKPAKRVLFYFMISFCLLISTFTLRNYIVSGHFVLISTNVGETFYLGNNSEANGIQAWNKDFKVIKEAVKEMTPSEEYSYWMEKTFESYRGDYTRFFFLTLKKVAFFLGSWDIPNNISLQASLKYSKILKFPMFQYSFFGPLGLTGMILMVLFYFRSRNILPVILYLSYFISVLPLMIHGRFRLAIMPFLIIYSGFLTDFFISSIKQKQKRQLLIGFGILILLFLLINYAINYENSEIPVFGFPSWIRY